MTTSSIIARTASTAPNIAYMKAYGLPAAELLIWSVALFDLVADA